MELELKTGESGREARERASALLVAAAVTFLVFAAIHAGFTPQATDITHRVLGAPALVL